MYWILIQVLSFNIVNDDVHASSFTSSGAAIVVNTSYTNTRASHLSVTSQSHGPALDKKMPGRSSQVVNVMLMRFGAKGGRKGLEPSSLISKTRPSSWLPKTSFSA